MTGQRGFEHLAHVRVPLSGNVKKRGTI
ncbi:hypothetical protein PLANTIT3_80109 [Plantibacter sp. T3]|nr:hypothetical protein PLANTIT3_80109 [Plantibacter sp. T3]